MATLYIEERTMLNKIEQLKVEKRKIDEVLEKVKGDTLQIQDYWSGKTGDAVKDELTEYTNEFDYISSKLEHQIKTLEETVRKYNKTNVATNTQIDDNSNVSAV